MGGRKRLLDMKRTKRRNGLRSYYEINKSYDCYDYAMSVGCSRSHL